MPSLGSSNTEKCACAQSENRAPFFSFCLALALLRRDSEGAGGKGASGGEEPAEEETADADVAQDELVGEELRPQLHSSLGGRGGP